MCRWLAYTGEPLQPAALILDAKHSVVAMSQNSPLGAETVNGDGFGLGWYPVEGEGTDAAGSRHPFVFRSIEPAWNDANLREISRAILSPLFFTHVRAAAAPPIQQTNCHPFRHEEWLFMHNGAISQFGLIKRELALAVDPSLYPEIQGTTDTEVLFHLALTFGLADDPVAAVGAAIRRVEEVGHAAGVQFPMQGTLAVSDGRTMWAFRYSSQGRSRTLFHSADVPTIRSMYPDAERLSLFGDHAQVVVSEPLNDLPGVFLEVPESTVAVLDPDGYHHRPFLDA
ncbi:class II glutamine amidotransferase [Microbacterium sp. M3]|uniref:Class II glutamine amidotransferase n=1 Tax=Microbacterium arthrosphaerae TaxID=792652 RepID=A0ABU4H4J9_9MICO|nr:MULTISPECIES: class II glutamine amidotransferase [Microbacterium]MDW4573667.1 class II glutamine amidotransferase [Microbacterium arthrosphaerae]MDW7607522.1 class II glutamine amidotransferase [Microbacterium sp. M3]